ncbi:MAG: hypothetical protein AAB380_00405, partial [Verrucomicrobiota bacterium]
MSLARVYFKRLQRQTKSRSADDKVIGQESEKRTVARFLTPLKASSLLSFWILASVKIHHKSSKEPNTVSN